MNGYLLDTNIPSEFSRDRPEPRVVQWLKSQPIATLFLSAVTIGEIRKGLVVMPQGRRRNELEAWFHTDLLNWFHDRILPVTHSIADRWGALDGHRQLMGTPLNTADGLIAATALEHDLTVVTRNVKDFAGLAVVVFDPWFG
ncbi:MAG TPA: type II toxin-antitoxin system VapC family toxin [Bryobacteraceae bacterium]|nr:type II toxin-antitoxin system VapC family toxin [Bryobacteraceae bacterium]